MTKIFKYAALIIVVLFSISCAAAKNNQTSNITLEISKDKPTGRMPMQTVFAPKQATLTTVYFEFNEYSLSEEAQKMLAQKIEAVQKANYIEIKGMSDERGSDQYNDNLSIKRADAVKKYYIEAGINPSKINVYNNNKERVSCLEKKEKTCHNQNRKGETIAYFQNVIEN